MIHAIMGIFPIAPVEKEKSSETSANTPRHIIGTANNIIFITTSVVMTLMMIGGSVMSKTRTFLKNLMTVTE